MPLCGVAAAAFLSLLCRGSGRLGGVWPLLPREGAAGGAAVGEASAAGGEGRCRRWPLGAGRLSFFSFDGVESSSGYLCDAEDGWEVFIPVSVILGDGIYNIIKIIYATIKEIVNTRSKEGRLPLVWVQDDDGSSKLSSEEKLLNEVFVKDSIPPWLAGSGYVGLAAISTATVPMMFPQLKWYLVLSAYVVAPLLAFCNSYGTGLTDWNLASTYGKIGLFIFASWVGQHGGVIAGLAASGVMMSIVSTAADLMQDFKTGYLTLSSPRSMFVSQLIGTALGFIFREMSILGVEGYSALPQHCLAICTFFFFAALAINLLKDVTPDSVSKFVPLPMAMAVPFYIGAYFAIDMFVGTVILFVWERVNRKESEDFAGAVASGLICGDGIWSVPSAILSIMRIDPPMCMYFKASVAYGLI
ncbi:hypothetical protein ACQ4PT_017933 [Festuca glaucescens]